MPTYAITGITGHVGGAAAELLLAAGANVRAVVRDESKAQPWRDRGADAALATLDDASALWAAFDGADGVFIMTPTWFTSEDMFAENAKALKALVQALRALPPAKIVLLSSGAAHRSHGTGAIMKLHDMEVAFADFAAVTSVRAGWFMENFAGMASQVRETGILPSMLAPLDRKIPMIATIDIGKTVAEVLQEDWSGQRIIRLEGPRRYSPNDVAAIFAHALGREVVAQLLPRSEWHSTYLSWGLTRRSADAMAEMLDAYNSGWISYETSDAEITRGITSLETVLSALVQR